jgi:HEAT repeat protein
MKFRWVMVLCVGCALVSGVGRARAQQPTYQGKPLSQWIDALKGKDLLARVRALNVLLAEAGPEARPAVPALIGVFERKDESFLHPVAAVALSKIGPVAVLELRDGLRHKDKFVRSGSALALGMMGDRARPATPALTRALLDKEALVRGTAAAALGQIGPGARSALPALKKLLEDDTPSVRVDAAEAVWAISGEADTVVPIFVAALDGKDVGLRTQAAGALAKVGPKAKEAGPALARALKADDVALRIAAAGAVYRVTGETREPLNVLARALRAKEEPVRRQAVAILDGMGGVERAELLLMGVLWRDTDAEVLQSAAQALAQAGAKRHKDLELVLTKPGPTDPVVRWWLAVGLLNSSEPGKEVDERVIRGLRQGLEAARKPGSLVDLRGGKGQRAVAPLIKALKTKNERLRKVAASSLELLGPDARPAAGALIETLEDPDEELWAAAVDALSKIGAETELVKAAGHRHPGVRAGALRALAQIGRRTRAVSTALRRGLRDRDAQVRVETAVGLWRLRVGEQDPVAFLANMLQDPEEKDPCEAARGLGEIHTGSGGAEREATEALVKALKSKDPRVRVYALRALWRVDREERVILPLVRDLMESSDVRVRRVAVQIVGELGRDAKVGPLLLDALQDRAPPVREEAMEALTRRGAEAVPLLQEALGHKSPAVRAGAAEVLGRIGRAAGPALGSLERLDKDKDEGVRKMAQWAREQIAETEKEILQQLKLLSRIKTATEG